MSSRARLRPLLAFWLALALVIAGAAAQDRFVPGTEDLPLMQGLSVIGEAVVFDKPEGRIVEVQARGSMKREAVRGFYAQTLPQLGWRGAAGREWRREGEVLRIDIGGRDGDVRVGFSLAPVSR